MQRGDVYVLGLCVWVLKDTYYLSIAQVTKSEMAPEIC